jgi:hypothetical protein
MGSWGNPVIGAARPPDLAAGLTAEERAALERLPT